MSAKTEQVLVKAGVLPHPANEWAGRLDQAMELAEVRQDILRSHFLAQILHESGMLRTTVERFNYSARRLFQVFPKYFRSMEAAMSAVNRPNREEYIANIVYANRMGNGPPSSGDGWRYRGRGLIQLTGRNNYRAMAMWMQDPYVVENPDSVADQYAALSAAFYWINNRLNAVALTQGIPGLTKAINGGTNGLEDRTRLTKLIREIYETMDDDDDKPQGSVVDRVRRIQGLIGAKVDGDFGPKTAEALKAALLSGKVEIFASERG